MTSTFLLIFVGLSLSALAGFAYCLYVVDNKRRELQFKLKMAQANTAKKTQALWAIANSGPQGSDPLPPCPWCAQGIGHWSQPKNPKCPAYVAWKILNSDKEADT